MPCRVLGMAMLALGALPARAATQVVAPRPGTFVGRDSLDARKEPGTASLARARVAGTATWTIERDSLDLRPKFTIRIELPAPSPSTLVLRMLDSLAPRPGQYEFITAASGVSHSRPGTVHANVYYPGVRPDREFIPMGPRDRLVITSVAGVGDATVVSGRVELRGGRYSNATRSPGGLDYVWLDVRGDFAARAATVPRPTIAVTPRMQEQVLVRALDGYAITFIGAINGDGDADSTRSPALARRFLDSRWRDAAIVERVEARFTGSNPRFDVRLRGRLAAVICEVNERSQYPKCVTLPEPVSANGTSPAALSGVVAARLSRGGRLLGQNTEVLLLPNPMPVQDAFEAWCASREASALAADRAFEQRQRAARTAAERDAIERQYIAETGKEDVHRDARPLFARHAVARTTTSARGEYAFNGIPAGNYLVSARVPIADPRERYPAYEWFVPVTVQGGASVTLALDEANRESREWSCGTPLPFPAVHERSR